MTDESSCSQREVGSSRDLGQGALENIWNRADIGDHSGRYLSGRDECIHLNSLM